MTNDNIFITVGEGFTEFEVECSYNDGKMSIEKVTFEGHNVTNLVGEQFMQHAIDLAYENLRENSYKAPTIPNTLAA